MAELIEGKLAPNFRLKDQDGNEVSLEDFRGKTVIVYFYPKDDTPGCTKEACSLRDAFPDLSAKGAVVLGISKDGVASHVKFRQKYSLPFTLLSDPDATVQKAWGAWGTKSMYGKPYEGTLRTTFVISPEGIIKKIEKKVSVSTHGSDVLAYI